MKVANVAYLIAPIEQPCQHVADMVFDKVAEHTSQLAYTAWLTTSKISCICVSVCSSASSLSYTVSVVVVFEGLFLIHSDPKTDVKKNREREQKWLKMLANWKEWMEQKKPRVLCVCCESVRSVFGEGEECVCVYEEYLQ